METTGMTGKECDPNDFLRKSDHDRSCPAMQTAWTHWIEEFMTDSKRERAALWAKYEKHDELIHSTIQRAQGWFIALLICIIGGFLGIVLTRYYSDVNIITEIHKAQTLPKQTNGTDYR